MRDFKIVIKMDDYEAECEAESIEEAREIAELEVDKIYAAVNGNTSVWIDTLEEIKK